MSTRLGDPKNPHSPALPAPLRGQQPRAASQSLPRRSRRTLAALVMVAAAVCPGRAQPAASEPAGQAWVGRVLHYEPVAQQIIHAALAHHDAWGRLQQLCDDIGHRFSGSVQLERAVAWAVQALQADGHENVRAEPLWVPRWVRGAESLELVEPVPRHLPMLGLGGSVGTPPAGITAPVVSVRSLEELQQLPRERVEGRIVLFDHPMPDDDAERGAGYGSAVRYRASGARWAAEHGAVACLVRSITTRSLCTPHTGGMSYRDAPRRIPAAAITVEDAALITRWQQRDIPVVVRLRMQARDEGQAPSANVIAELCGRERPDEVVLIGGHLDSWDVGQGAHDDGAGCVTAMEALRLLRRLGLVPRRTIRVVLFTNEENGLAGARHYAATHAAELPAHVAAIEADAGGFRPRGFSIEHRDEPTQAWALAQLATLLRLLEPIGATQATGGGSGADLTPLGPAGVVRLGLATDMTRYFDIHHTAADTLDKVDPDELSQNVAAMAVLAYVLADMPGRLGDPPPGGAGP